MIDNPAAVEERIQELDGRMDKCVQEIARRSTFAAETEADYREAHAKAVLLIRDEEKGKPRSERSTVDEVEARAAIATQQAYRAMRFAEADLKAAQSAARLRQSQMDGQRSLYSGIKALVQA